MKFSSRWRCEANDVNTIRDPEDMDDDGRIVSISRIAEDLDRKGRMQFLALGLGFLALVLLPGGLAAQQVPPAVLAELAPTGTLRVGIHYVNIYLVTKHPETSELRGVAIDLARELGRRIGVPLEFVGYANATRLARAAGSGEWDIAFLAAESSRATEITFTNGFAEIEATYLVPAHSTLRTIEEADREGVRVAVARQSALDHILTRSLKNAQLVRGQGFDGAASVFVSDKLDALAGLRPRLLADSEKLPGSRVLSGGFAVLPQAIAIPNGRGAAAAYVRAFVEDAKASGMVAKALEESGVRGVAVAPRARGF